MRELQLGSNGIGKSCFTKSCIDVIKYKGKIEEKENIVVIGSYSGIPMDLKMCNVHELLMKKCKNIEISYIL